MQITVGVEECWVGWGVGGRSGAQLLLLGREEGGTTYHTHTHTHKYIRNKTH